MWHDASSDRYIKLTKPNCFGFTVGAEWFFDDEKDEAELKPALPGATPLEYLERLRLHNAVFGDRIELLGIIDKRQALLVVTSQPTIRGSATPGAEIVWFMRQLGFMPLPRVSVGRLDARAFLRDSDGVAAFDCHPANFLTCEADVFPIDVIVPASEELRAALSNHP